MAAPWSLATFYPLLLPVLFAFVPMSRSFVLHGGPRSYVSMPSIAAGNANACEDICDDRAERLTAITPGGGEQ